jgi:hypothetical protein
MKTRRQEDTLRIQLHPSPGDRRLSRIQMECPQVLYCPDEQAEYLISLHKSFPPKES